MEILRKNQKEMLEIKTTGREMKNAFGVLMTGCTEERIGELQTISIEISKTEKQRGQRL